MGKVGKMGIGITAAEKDKERWARNHGGRERWGKMGLGIRVGEKDGERWGASSG